MFENAMKDLFGKKKTTRRKPAKRKTAGRKKSTTAKRKPAKRSAAKRKSTLSGVKRKRTATGRKTAGQARNAARMKMIQARAKKLHKPGGNYALAVKRAAAELKREGKL